MDHKIASKNSHFHLFSLLLEKAHHRPCSDNAGHLPESSPCDRGCLCQEIKWMWHLSQLMGINPLSINCTRTSAVADENVSRPRLDPDNIIKCRLTKKKLSYPYISAVYIILTIIPITYVVGQVFDAVVKTLFTGTDAYAFKLHFSCRISQTIAVILCGLLFSRHLIRAWHSMQTLARALNHRWSPSVRKYSRILTILAIVMGLGNLGYSLAVGIKLCWLKRLDLDGTVEEVEGKINEKCEEFGMTAYVLFVWIMSSSEFTHLTLSGFVCVMALVMKSLHQGLASMLQQTLDQIIQTPANESNIADSFITGEDVPSYYNYGGHQFDGYGHRSRRLDRLPTSYVNAAKDVETIRLLYEELLELMVHVRKFFGAACLIVCCDAILTCICGLYWRIVFFEILADLGKTSDMFHLFLFNLHFNYSVYSLLLILVSGHIMNVAALETPKVLRTSRLSHLCPATRFQISLLMQVSTGFPPRFTVYSITTLEMPFLAAATTNVITYLLVMMQFRLEQKA